MRLSKGTVSTPHLNKCENRSLNPGCLIPLTEISQLQRGSSHMKVLNGAAYSNYSPSNKDLFDA